MGTVDFKNTIVIMTSNIGSNYLIDNIKQDGSIEPAVKNRVEEKLKSNFRPEFINRIDDIVVFSPLTSSQIGRIIDISLNDIRERLGERGIDINLSYAAKELIQREAYTPAYGARPIKRYLQRHIETKIAEMIVRGEVMDDSVIKIDAVDGELKFEV